MPSEAQKRAASRYNRRNTINCGLKLNKNTDADIIAKLEEVGNRSGYIKRLIREDIARED